jgi:hypothetical protein
MSLSYLSYFMSFQALNNTVSNDPAIMAHGQLIPQQTHPDIPMSSSESDECPRQEAPNCPMTPSDESNDDDDDDDL